MDDMTMHDAVIPLITPLITIDGPSGSGKGTVSAYVAKQLGWQLLDSGALYRLVALSALNHQVPSDDEAALTALAQSMKVSFDAGCEPQALVSVMLDGIEVNQAIRGEDCAAIASQVAALAGVREALLARQQAFSTSSGLVADGRDMGTVVFPHAPLKVFLVASAEERAKRRYKQLKDKGIDVNLATLLDEINRRDERDSNRKLAPMRPAADAHTLDTTEMSIDEVVEAIVTLWKKVTV